jgi:hypothetical protein
VFWEIGITNSGNATLNNPQSQNSYSYAGNNPILNSDPDGKWFKEFITGQQSFNDFSVEVGQTANQMAEDSKIWNFAFEHPYATGGAVGVGIGMATYGVAYGATTAISQISVGINLARLSKLPTNPRVDNTYKYGFDAIKAATGLGKTEAIQFVESVGKSLVDMRPKNFGNINNIANVGNKVIRITTDGVATKIFSSGIISTATKVSNYVSSGAMRSVPVITSIAKSITRFVSSLTK